MGAGKTSVGKALAVRLGVPFVDTDALIERAAGSTIAEIFAAQGEDAFRALETKTLAALDPASPAVYATGGGIVTRDENWPLLKRLGRVVHLHAAAEVLFERVRDESHRPLLKTPNPLQSFTELYRLREALYGQADVTVDTDGKPPAAVAEEIQRHLFS